MNREDVIVEKTYTIETRNKGRITVRRTERQLTLMIVMDDYDQTLDNLRTERDKYICDRVKYYSITEKIRYMRKELARLGKEFWEIDERINPEYHDPASWDRDALDDNNKYVSSHDIKIINEVFNRRS